MNQPHNWKKSRNIIDSQQIPPTMSPPKMLRQQDHTHAFSVSPNKLKKQLHERFRKKNQVMKNLWRNIVTKEKTIKGTIAYMKHAKVLSTESFSSLGSNFGHLVTDPFKNVSKNNGRSSGPKYSGGVILKAVWTIVFYFSGFYMK